MAAFGHPSNAAYPPWAPVKTNEVTTKPNMYFPDLVDNNNCILGNTYEDWMGQEGFDTFYLFSDGSDCCKMW